MPVLSPDTFEIHGSTFVSYARTGRGSSQLCAWRLEVPPGTTGVPHRPDREEVLLVLSGELHATVDGTPATLGPGEVLLVPAGALLSVDAGPDGATAWVTTTPGLSAVTADGTRLRPPWAQ
ncbi:cupin domain-containing protein [Kineosporia sp. R_H_3]|uniref:cupin domain-containing protein n=1 Tax=Kineosporia sp. R_H_3 TaxID=1961848 RepID=UPI000B4B4975|nr:cupin domain-containing protein [Kineosporia sp. R_H_3]